MNNILSMTMVDKLIGSAPFVYEGDFAQGIYLAANLGYTGVELHIANPSRVDIRAIRSAIMATGLRLTAIGTGRAYVNEGLSLSDPISDVRQRAEERVRAFIDFASEFESAIIIGCMRGNVTKEQGLENAIALLSDSMRRIDALAAQKNVTVVFEPINRYENNFLCNMREIKAFIQENQLKNTGILIDTFHMNIEEPNFIQSILACSGLIRYVHASDSNRQYPGCGHIPFPQIFETLRQIGYHGPVSAECLPWPDKTMAARKWLAVVREMV